MQFLITCEILIVFLCTWMFGYDCIKFNRRIVIPCNFRHYCSVTWPRNVLLGSSCANAPEHGEFEFEIVIPSLQCDSGSLAPLRCEDIKLSLSWHRSVLRDGMKRMLDWFTTTVDLIITATYGPNISGCYTEVAALQRCKCVESHHLGFELGGCNNEVAA